MKKVKFSYIYEMNEGLQLVIGCFYGLNIMMRIPLFSNFVGGTQERELNNDECIV